MSGSLPCFSHISASRDVDYLGITLPIFLFRSIDPSVLSNLMTLTVDPDGDDECSVGMMVEDGPAGGIAIVLAVSQHCGNRAGDLDEKRTDHGGFALVRGAT